MSNTTVALTVVMFMNLFLFLWQVSVLELNPDAATNWNYKGTIYEKYNTGQNGKYALDITEDSISGDLPEGQAGVEIGTSGGNFFTDTFKNIRSWFNKGLSGLSYAKNILSAPYNALNSVDFLTKNAPALVFILGTFWYGLSIFLIIQLFWGRE